MLVNKLMAILFFCKMFNSNIFKKAILSLEEKKKEVSQLKKKKNLKSVRLGWKSFSFLLSNCFSVLLWFDLRVFGLLVWSFSILGTLKKDAKPDTHTWDQREGAGTQVRRQRIWYSVYTAINHNQKILKNIQLAELRSSTLVIVSSLQLATVHIWDHSGAPELRITVQNPKIRKAITIWRDKENTLTSPHIICHLPQNTPNVWASCWSHAWERLKTL